MTTTDQSIQDWTKDVRSFHIVADGEDVGAVLILFYNGNGNFLGQIEGIGAGWVVAIGFNGDFTFE